MSYQGHTNKPTWTVNLWLGNDEATYRQVNELAHEAIQGNDTDEAVIVLADKIKELIEPENEATGMYRDLLQDALNEVDYESIARYYIEDIQEQ